MDIGGLRSTLLVRATLYHQKSKLCQPSWTGFPKKQMLRYFASKTRKSHTTYDHAYDCSAEPPNPELAESRVNMILKTGGEKLALAWSHAGATALRYAASQLLPVIICRLYKAGKVAFQTNSLKGGTPLHQAAGKARTDHKENLQALVECGANVDALNKEREYPHSCSPPPLPTTKMLSF